jgi:U1 small nuclear ribonucleoprotein
MFRFPFIFTCPTSGHDVYFMKTCLCLKLLDNPQDDPNIRGDAFKTLIVARLSYDAAEQDLESEFGRFGPIERVRFINNSEGFMC